MGVMVFMNWRLALVTFAVIPLFFVVTNWFRRGSRRSFREVRKWIARINAFLQENITGMSTVQLFRREALNFEQFDEIDRKHRDANVDSIFYYAVFYPAIEAVSALAAALIIWYGGANVLAGTLTLGALVAFLQYSQRFFRPISDMSEKFNVLQGAMASSERIFALLDTPVSIQSGLGTRDSGFDTRQSSPESRIPNPESRNIGRIAFESVTFAYVEGESVLRDVSFAVEPGQRVAIVGATGSGKTTIVSLLLRFYDVQQGRITVGGVDIRDMDLRRLRAMFGLVLQDVHLFSGTIGGNVRLGNEAIDDATVRRAVDA
jgi:ATP-binding cassette subfamily B protein